jgi:hypothetical protein
MLVTSNSYVLMRQREGGKQYVVSVGGLTTHEPYLEEVNGVYLKHDKKIGGFHAVQYTPITRLRASALLRRFKETWTQDSHE